MATQKAVHWAEEVQELLEDGSVEELASCTQLRHDVETELARVLEEDPKAVQQIFQAAAARLQQLAAPGPELLQQELHMSAASAILRLVPSGVGAVLAGIFVSTGIIASFGSLMVAFTSCPGDLKELESRPVGHELLALLLQCTMDTCEGAFKRGQGPTISCRDICGHEMLGNLLKLAHRLSKHCSVTSKRLSTELLLAFMTKSRSNIEIVRGNCRQDFLDLYRELLPSCGDFATQVNLVEVLYRLAKNNLMELCLEALGTPEDEAAPPAKLFRALASKSYTGLDLAKELRKIVLAYNTFLGPSATVQSVFCERIDISLPLVESAAQWIDIGAGKMLSMSILIQDPEDTAADIPPDILDIPFHHLTSVTLNDTGTPDCVRVDLLVNQLPDLLQSQPHLENRPLKVKVSLSERMAQELLLALPALDRSRLLRNQSQQHGALWAQLSQERQPAGSRQGTVGSGCRPTQRPQKMSIGMTTYKPLVLQPARAPALATHAKPPLPLTAVKPGGTADAPRAAAAAGAAAAGDAAPGTQAPLGRKAAASDPGRLGSSEQQGRARGMAASEGAAPAMAAQPTPPAQQSPAKPGRSGRKEVDAEPAAGEDEAAASAAAAAAPSLELQEEAQSPKVEPGGREPAGEKGAADAGLHAASDDERSLDQRHRQQAQEVLLSTPESRGKALTAGAGSASDVGLGAGGEVEQQQQEEEQQAEQEQPRSQHRQQQQQQPHGEQHAARPAAAVHSPSPAPPVLSQRALPERSTSAAGSRPAAQSKAAAAALAIAAEVVGDGSHNCTFGDGGGGGHAAPTRKPARSNSSAKLEARPPPVATRTRAHDRQAVSEGRGRDAKKGEAQQSGGSGKSGGKEPKGSVRLGSKRPAPEPSVGDPEEGRQAKEARVGEEEPGLPAAGQERQRHRQVPPGAGGAAGKPPLAAKGNRSASGAGSRAAVQAPGREAAAEAEGGEKKAGRRVSPRRLGREAAASGAGPKTAQAPGREAAVEAEAGEKQLERRVSPRRLGTGGAGSAKAGTVTTARLGKARAAASGDAAAAAAPAAKAGAVRPAASDPGSQPDWMLAGDEPEAKQQQLQKAPVTSAPRRVAAEAGTPVSSGAPRAQGRPAQPQQPPRSPYDFESEDEGPTITGDHLASAAARAGERGRGGAKTPVDTAGMGRPAAGRRGKAAAAASGKEPAAGKGGRGRKNGGGAAGEGKKPPAASKKGGAAEGAAAPAAKGRGRQAGGKRQQQQGAGSPDPIEDSERQDLPPALQGGALQDDPAPAAAEAKAGAKRKADGQAKAKPRAGGRVKAAGSAREGDEAPGEKEGVRAGSKGLPGKQAAPAAAPALSKELSELQQQWSQIDQEELLVDRSGGSGEEGGREVKRRRVEGERRGESQHEAHAPPQPAGRGGLEAGRSSVPREQPRPQPSTLGAGDAAAAVRGVVQAPPAAGPAEGRSLLALRDVLDSAYQLKAPKAAKGQAPGTQHQALVRAAALGSAVAVGRLGPGLEGSRARAGSPPGLGAGEEEHGSKRLEEQAEVPQGYDGEVREESETSLGGAVKVLRLSSVKKSEVPRRLGTPGAEEEAGGDELGSAGDGRRRVGSVGGEGAKRKLRGGAGDEDGGARGAGVRGGARGGAERRPFALAPLPSLEGPAAAQQQAMHGRSAAADALARLGDGQAGERHRSVAPAAEVRPGKRPAVASLAALGSLAAPAGAEPQARERPALAPLAALGSLAAPAAPTSAHVYKLDLPFGRATGGRGSAGAGTDAGVSVGVGAAGAGAGARRAAAPAAPLRLPSVALGRGKKGQGHGQGRGQAQGGNMMSDLVALLLGQEEEGEGGETADEDSRQLQALMLKIIENKKAKLKKRKEALMQDFLDRMGEGERSLEAARAKIKQAAQQAIQGHLDQHQQALDAKHAEIRALIRGFQAQLQVMWGEYEKEYRQMDLVREEMEGTAEAHAQQEQQVIQAYSAEVTAELAKLEEQLQTMDSKGRGVPDLAFLTKGSRR